MLDAKGLHFTTSVIVFIAQETLDSLSIYLTFLLHAVEDNTAVQACQAYSPTDRGLFGM